MSILVLVILVPFSVLEYFLTMKKKKWGIVLPILSFLASLLYLFLLFPYTQTFLKILGLWLCSISLLLGWWEFIILRVGERVN